MVNVASNEQLWVGNSGAFYFVGFGTVIIGSLHSFVWLRPVFFCYITLHVWLLNGSGY